MWKQRCVYAVDAQRLFERRDDAACLLLALWRQREMMFLRWKRSSVWCQSALVIDQFSVGISIKTVHPRLDQYAGISYSSLVS